MMKTAAIGLIRSLQIRQHHLRILTSFARPLNILYCADFTVKPTCNRLNLSPLKSMKILQKVLEFPWFIKLCEKTSNSTSARTIHSCWKCNSENEILSRFCAHCKVILPFDKSLNYFEILGIEESYAVSKDAITSNFRNLQSVYHPDKFSVKSEKEQSYASEHSAAMNKAYRVLCHPVERAEYLLELAGIPLEEGELTVDPVFLMEIMEINEKLADATDKDVINDIAEQNNNIMNKLVRAAEEAFSLRDLPLARQIVTKMKYYNNIYEKVKEYELIYGIVR